MFIEFHPETVDGKKSTFRVKASERDGTFEISNMSGDGKVSEIDIKSIDLKKNALLKLDFNGTTERVQFLASDNDIEFKFYWKGATRKVNVYDSHQHHVAKHMPVPHVIDLKKVIISPMPGSIIAVEVQVGQTIIAGQNLLTIEAMKMQNLIKAENDGKIKSVKVKPGQSVGVDEILIEFE
jgi:biotin carboxyl carrier protein